MQKILLTAQRKAMLNNGRWNLAKRTREGGETDDFHPVVKLFCPWGAATWLLTELDEDGVAFGLCDLGQGEPELGYVSLAELRELRGPGGLYIERDIHFRPRMTLAGYATAARAAGRIAA